jgi:ABC-type cobalt transport system substrate-binding protein
MDFETQLKIERAVVAVIAVGSIVIGYVLGYMEIATWTY